MYGNDVISGRTTGAFPLSIGTSLAFESVFIGTQAPYDPDREIPNKVDAKAYEYLFINISTLFRNISGAVERDSLPLLSEHDYADAIKMEMDVIKTIASTQSSGFCKPIFYYCDYKTPYTKSHRVVQLRHDNTDGQKAMTAKLVKAARIIIKEHEGDEDFKHWDDEIKPPTNRPRALILTHVPHDLLSSSNMRELDLLESHTGKLKPRNLWYTKYHGVPGAEMVTLPFNRKFLLIFGDSVMYKPFDIRFRREIMAISQKCRWTPLTTMDKIKMDLEINLKERYMYDLFKEL